METYIKDFKSWNSYKITIDSYTSEHLFREREIWWCALGVNIGSEQDGKNQLYERPVLVLKKINKELLLVAPLTSNLVKNEFNIMTDSTGETSQILLSQIRSISSKRLLRRIGRIKNETFNKVIVKISLIFLQTIQNETPL
jgi:mRNA interferase MazF